MVVSSYEKILRNYSYFYFLVNFGVNEAMIHAMLVFIEVGINFVDIVIVDLLINKLSYLVRHKDHLRQLCH